MQCSVVYICTTDYKKLDVKLFIINYIYYVEVLLITNISTEFYKVITFIYLSGLRLILIYLKYKVFYNDKV